MIEITNDNFEELVLKSEVPVLVDFWASWCGPCQMMLPIITKMAEEFENKALVVKINVEEQSDIATKYGIRNIPAFLFFKDGEIVDKAMGGMPKSKLTEKLEALLTVEG